MKTVALYYNPWPDNGLARSRDAAGLYRYAVWYKSNPRDASYMRALLAERYAEADWIDVARQTDWRERVAQADRVLLLYPDAIGLGWHGIEREVLRQRKTWAGIHALTGRKREFLLNRATLRGLRTRRMIEWSMLGEWLFLPVFVLATPMLLVWDRLRGHA